MAVVVAEQVPGHEGDGSPAEPPGPPDRRPPGRPAAGRGLRVLRLSPGRRSGPARCRRRPWSPGTSSAAGLVDRAADDRVALCLVDGHDSPVTRVSSIASCRSSTTPSTGTLSPGSQHERVADDDLGGGDLDLCAVADHRRRGRHQVEQGAQGVGGAACGSSSPSSGRRARRSPASPPLRRRSLAADRQ